MKTHNNYYAGTRTYAGHRMSTHSEIEHGLGYYEVTMQGKCAGTFVNNQVHGRAAKTWIQGETYVGQYSNNNKEGNGVHTWASGAMFVGQFSNNQPNGFGILTTVHNGIKFIGTVSGMVATPRVGEWYTADNIKIDPASVGIDNEGCVCTAQGVTMNAVGETITVNDDGSVTTIEKNLKTTMFDAYNGERTTYHYGDWIHHYKGGIRNGRCHGNGHIEFHNGWQHSGVFSFGHDVNHLTYTSVATSTSPTRSTQRRLDRNYCMIYDMMIAHHHEFVKRPPVIVEFGIGRGDHLVHLRHLFPDAVIIAVDKLSPTSVPTTDLEAQQVNDLKIAAQLSGVEFYFNTDCYDKQSIYNIVTAHGDFDFAIHDATHTDTAWNELNTIKEVLSDNYGILITEEMCCNNNQNDDNSINWQQIELAIDNGWRIWDCRIPSKFKYQNSVIGVYMNGKFDGSDLNMYEIGRC